MGFAADVTEQVEAGLAERQLGATLRYAGITATAVAGGLEYAAGTERGDSRMRMFGAMKRGPAGAALACPLCGFAAGGAILFAQWHSH